MYKLLSDLLIYRAVLVESIEAPYRALASAQHPSELAVHASQTGLWDSNLQTGEVYCSPAWKARLGDTADEIENDFASWERLLHPDDCVAAPCGARRTLPNRPGSAATTGSWRAVNNSSTPSAAPCA